jgi:hypothetical protein
MASNSIPPVLQPVIILLNCVMLGIYKFKLKARELYSGLWRHVEHSHCCENFRYNQTNSVAWVRERTIPTERPSLVGEISPNVCGSLRPYSRLSRPEQQLFLPRSSFQVATSHKMW